MDAAAIEQANKLRKAIGLAPLPVPGIAATGPSFKDHESSDESSEEAASTLETREAASYANYKQVQDEAEAKKRREAKAAAIKKARDAAQRFARLDSGKGLGEADESGDLDAKAWLRGQNKRQKKIEKERAQRMAEELAERERLAALDYGAEDLAGVKVAHEAGDFVEEEGEQVLTLVDKAIDENDEDELENFALKEREALKERLDIKKRRPVYDPNAEENGAQILSQYDEEIDGKKRKRFTLGEPSVEEREAKRQEIGDGARAQLFNLDIMKEEQPSDYLPPTIKKAKKPKKTRRREVDDEEIFPATTRADTPMKESPMEILQAPQPSSYAQDARFDDDALQTALTFQRRAALAKKRKQRPEDIARQIKEDAEATPDEVDSDPEPGLIFSENTDFVARVRRPSLGEQNLKPNVRARTQSPEDAAMSDGEDGHVEGESKEDETELSARLRDEKPTETSDLTETGLDREVELDGSGLGATFNLLKERGLVKTADMGDINALHRDRQRFLAEKQQREAAAEQRARLQRERDRASGKLDHMSARDRELYRARENKQREQMTSVNEIEIFNRDYKPNVTLSYVDDHNRLMGPKEAFKHLSHQFHGKGSGKQKMEKHLKKIEDEKKREAYSALDGGNRSSGMNYAAGSTAKKNKQAGVRLA